MKNNFLDKQFPFFLLTISFLGVYLNEVSAFDYFVGGALLYSIGLIIVRSVKYQNYVLLIMAFFMSSYCVVPLFYLFHIDQHILERFTKAESHSTVYFTSICLLVFLQVFTLKVKFENKPLLYEDDKLVSANNSIGFFAAVVISMLCILYGVSGDNLFEAGGYARGNSERSSLYEYGIIGITLSLIYANKKIDYYLVYLLSLTYIIKDMMYGGRVASVMLILAIFMIKFQKTFNFRQILLFAIAGYSLFTFWGFYRSDLNTSAIEFSNDKNAIYVFYASMRIHYFLDHDILNWGLRLSSFLYFVLSAIIPYRMLPDISNLASYLQKDYYSGGGGLVSTFFYTWLWWPGVIFIAYYIARTINTLSVSNSPYVRYYAILLITMTPRWFAYYPISIIKFSLYGIVLFWVLNKFSNRN